jgi:tripartite-type tricarboxylate transporter receptor subunit TctC
MVEGTMKLAANVFAALLVLLAVQTASAQSSYPNRPVKILVGFTPGTAPDLAISARASTVIDVVSKLVAYSAYWPSGRGNARPMINSA